MSLTHAQLTALARRFAAEPHRWADLVRHDSDQRSYALLHEDADVSVWLLCWSADQDTGFHDHDTSAAAITVLSGNVREDRMRLGAGPVSRIAGPGDTITVPAAAIHRVLHAGDAPAVTIHAYSPPLTRTGAYTTGPDGELLRHVQDGREELRADAVDAVDAAELAAV